MTELDKYTKASNTVEKFTNKPQLLLIPVIVMAILFIINPMILVTAGVGAVCYGIGKMS